MRPSDYPFLIIPNRLARGLAKEWSLRKLTRIVEASNVPVGPPVCEYSWLKDRQLRMALSTGQGPAGVRVRKVAADMRDVAEAVRSYAGTS